MGDRLLEAPDCQVQGLGSLCREYVLVNFICQLDWARGCPDIWSNMILAKFGQII